MRRPPASLASTLALALGSTVTSTGMGTGFGVLYPAIVSDQGWTVSEVTATYSLTLLIYAPITLACGVLFDRYGLRTLMLVGCVLIGVGLTLFSRATSLLELYLGWMVAGAFGLSATGFVPMYKLLAVRAGPYFPQALGVATAGPGISALVLAPLLQFGIDLGGWRLAAGTMGVIVPVLMALLVLWGAPARPASTPGERSISAPRIHWFSDVAVWLVFLSAMSRGYLVLLSTHQVAHLQHVGFSPAFAAAVAGLSGLMQALTALSIGWPIARWGSYRVHNVAFILLVVGVTALSASTPMLVWLPLPYILFSAAGRAAFNVCHNTVARDQYGSATFGRMGAMIEVGFAAGAFLGPTLVAVTRDVTGSFVPGLLTAFLAGVVSMIYMGSAARAGFGLKDSVQRP